MLRLLGNKVLFSNGVVLVKNKDELFDIVKVLKYNSLTRFNVLVDVVGIDLRDGTYVLHYILLSTKFNVRIILSCVVAEEVDSLGSLYSGSCWLEREVFDMLGLRIRGHKDLRRLLTDYGFKGNPLKKSFIEWEDRVYSEVVKLARKR